jgi:hypothetical protein
MPYPDDSPHGVDFPNVILTRMRRRTGRLGVFVATLMALATALVIFVICACKGIGHVR